MKKIWGKVFLLISICVVIIFSMFIITYFKMPPVFADSYQRGFNYQYDALERAGDSPKIIVLGGSYMTFATDSTLLSKLSGMPSYTLGVNSGMGMCYIFETTEKFINKDDIILFSFLPFQGKDYGMDLIFLSFENEPKLFLDFFKTHPQEVVKTIAPCIYTKLYNNIYQSIRWFILRKIGSDSVYTAAAFDKTSGNMIYPRPSIDPNISDSEFEQRITYKTSGVDSACIDVINEFYDFCKNHKAKFYITYSPVYEGAVASTEQEILEYETWLSKQLKCKIISCIKDNELSKDCIFNGALHMNDKGAKMYTEQLYRDLKPYIHR